jgi:methionyl-tRNA synthetase
LKIKIKKEWPIFFFYQLMSQNLLLLSLLIAWSLFWKGIALWKSARNDHKGWFISILLLNTLGILEMIYIFVVNRKKRAK